MISDVTYIATTVGLSSSALLSGYISTYSIAAVPALLSPAAGNISSLEKARLWQLLYNIGALTAPVLAVLPTASFVYLAFQAPSLVAAQATLFLYAAGLTMSIAPFTLIGMRGVNGKLHARAAAKDEDDLECKERDGGKVRDLLLEWTLWNGARSLLPLAACGLGWRAAGLAPSL